MRPQTAPVEAAVEAGADRPRGRELGLFALLSKDPLWLREFRASSRLVRTPWLLAGTSLAMTAALCMAVVTSSGSMPPAALGQLAFQIYFCGAVGFVLLFGPAIAASSIAIEREGRTWEPLVMAGLAPRAIDRGKFLAAYTHLCLYLFALLPAAGVAHLFGGVSLGETLVGEGVLLLVAALAVRLGLLMSALLPTSRVALLVTLASSAGLCFVAPVFGHEMNSFLRHRVGMTALEGGEIFFWPVAFARASMTFDWARYVVLIPLGLATVAWFALRESSVSALAYERRDLRPLRRAFAWLTVPLALVLGLFARESLSELLFAETLFMGWLFGAILVLGGDRSPGKASLGTSLLLFGGGVVGVALIGAVTVFVAASRGTTLSTSSIDHVLAMGLYGPAFSLFVIGAAAYARARFKRPLVGRAGVLGLTLIVSLGPAFAAVALSLLRGESVADWAMGMTPLGVFKNMAEVSPVVVGAGFWASVGVLLLAVTHRRERREMLARA